MLNKIIEKKVKKGMFKGAIEMRQLNKTVPVSGRRFEIPLEGRSVEIVYYEAENTNAPLIIGIHGGGYVFGGSALDDKLWKELCLKTNSNVVSIEYRKAPEFMYPSAIEDIYETYIYLKNNSEEFGFDKEHISFFGSSAGANLSVATFVYSIEKGDAMKLDCMFLNYPWLDLSKNSKEMGAKGIEKIMYNIFKSAYTNEAERKLPTVSPLFCSNEIIKKLPTALVSVAGNDILKSDGEKFCELYSLVGNVCKLNEAKGMPHGYYEHSYGEILDYMSKEQKELLSNGRMQEEKDKTLDFFAREYMKIKK